VPKTLISLWIVINEIEPMQEDFHNEIIEFLNKAIIKWEENNSSGKGLSDFISRKLIQSFMEKKDYFEFSAVLMKI
jgi:hypothetical protein